MLLPELQILDAAHAGQIRHLVVHFACIDESLHRPRYRPTMFDEAVRLAQDLVFGGVPLTAVRAGNAQDLDAETIGTSRDYAKVAYAQDVREEFETLMERVRDHEHLVWKFRVVAR